ncbi:MAG TPA: hypothetical protein VIW23_09540 [Candidatus Acidoferrum sp.]|jgi:hypothetical protein
MFSDLARWLPLLIFVFTPAARAQTAARGGCNEIPREDALPSLCAPPTSVVIASPAADSVILLELPAGTVLRVAVDHKVRVGKPGQIVSARLTDPVYAFDQQVIPAGSVVSGELTEIHPITRAKKAMSYVNGNFSVVHGYDLEFDSVIFPNGEQRKIRTSVSPGIAQAVHLVAGGRKEKKQNVAQREVHNAKAEAEGKVHDTLDEIKAPGKMQRLKDLVLAQSPYRRQYLQPGTRFYASLAEPLDFGKTTRTAEQLAQLGKNPEPDSVLHARLAEQVSSATAQRGNSIMAVLTEPLFSRDRHLVLPANSRIEGEVIKAKPARKLHHNGDLRVIFNRIETPEGVIQPMQGTVEGIEADRHAGVKLDEEGGAQATERKTRYLSTGFALLMAAAASRPDVEHGTTDTAGDPSVRAGAGVSGSGITGTVISLAAKSQPVSIAFAAYGAGISVYNNFLSRGRDVVFLKDTPLEIGFSEAHPRAAKRP